MKFIGNSHARIDAPDAALLAMAFGIAVIALGHQEPIAQVVGIAAAYIGLLTALVVIPHKWFTDDE